MTSPIHRDQLADHILSRLAAEAPRLAETFAVSGQVPSAVLDDVLPEDVAKAIFDCFPAINRMMAKISIKERKFVGAQMDGYDPLLEEAVYAFQDSRVVSLIGEITGLRALEPDTQLYAGGLSLMSKGGYLRPHLDNSHDKDRQRYRVLNLLYYVTPDWSEAAGGSLQLWDQGPEATPRTIPSQFNRLVLMATNRTSWHSVNEIVGEGARCCISNYYFSDVSPEARDYFHATSFRSEPGRQPLADLVMRGDNAVRTAILKTLPGVYKNPHVYKRSEGSQ
jgi:Rps23 Pro-64 3,4-dihydroxylase Tpa1-like proline 4-hydroxylase